MIKEDFGVRTNIFHIKAFLTLNARIYVKINKESYEQIYIDDINDNGSIIIYDNKFNRRFLSDYISEKRNLKRASSTLRFIYYSFDNEEKLYRLYDYLSNIQYV